MNIKIGGNTVVLAPKYQVFVSLLAGLSYALAHGLFRLVSDEPIQVGQLLFQTIFFSGCWYFISFKLKGKKEEQPTDLVRDSSLAFYGAAHQRIQKSTVVGMLYATDKQLIFEPNAKGFVSSPWVIDWVNIERVQYYTFLGLFNHGLLIQTKGKMEYKVIVNQPQVWLQAIQTKIES
ncbi:hypothetical protein [Myroides odoratus]|uniref:hypothetical protein n=1 Tax=Myroides odoratus TaxID=256 RepID=UPI00333F7333